MKIRTENINDYKVIEELIKVAFMSAEHSDGDEHNLVSRIRSGDKYIPDLSIVAEKNNRIIGHILLSEMNIIDNEINHPGLVLAPLSVLPEYQKQGIGRALVNEAINKADNMHYKSVLSLGYPLYYSKFGFRKAKEHGITSTFLGLEDYMMIKSLGNNKLKDIKGCVIYGKEFLK